MPISLIISDDDPIHEAGHAPLAILSSHPDAVIALAHAKLYAFSFQEVPVCWRRLYEEASLWKAMKMIEVIEYDCQPNGVRDKCDDNSHHDDDIRSKHSCRAEIVRILDMALILTGAPGRRDIIDLLLKDLDGPQYVGEQLQSSQRHEIEAAENTPHPRPSKRRRLSNSPPRNTLNKTTAPRTFPSPSKTRSPIIRHPIPRLSNPTLNGFTSRISTPRGPSPIILTDTLSHWPALHLWQDPNYWLRRTHSGLRLVPVELGRSYTDAEWGQKIMPFGTFLHEHLLRDYKDPQDHSPRTTQTAYLAQHDLLAQIPALRADIAVPDYCYVDIPEPPISNTKTQPHTNTDTPSSSNNKNSNSPVPSETPPPPPPVLLNIWLGPANVLSPAHTDPHHNLLAQVLGTKYVRLYAPDAGARALYPMSGSSGGSRHDTTGPGPEPEPEPEQTAETSAGPVDMSNTARVDVGLEVEWTECDGGDGDGAPDAGLEAREERAAAARAQAARFPMLRGAEYVETVLRAGEVLFIPRGWWHYVEAFAETGENEGMDGEGEGGGGGGDGDSGADEGNGASEAGNGLERLQRQRQRQTGVACSVSFWWD